MDIFKKKKRKITIFRLDPKSDITSYESALLLKFSRGHSTEEIVEELPDSCKRHLKKIEITYSHSLWGGTPEKESEREIEW